MELGQGAEDDAVAGDGGGGEGGLAEAVDVQDAELAAGRDDVSLARFRQAEDPPS